MLNHIEGIVIEYVDYTGEYDAAAHDISVIVDAHGATLTFSTDMENWSSEMPVVRDVSDSGTYYIKASRAGSHDVYYRVNTVITKAALEVAADDQKISIRDDLPVFTYLINGLKGSDTEADLDCTIVFVTDYVKGTDPVGTYSIFAAEEFIDGNYEITSVGATLTVEQHTAYVDWLYIEYLYNGRERPIAVDVTDENGKAIPVKIEVYDMNGNPTVFKEVGTYIAKVIIPEVYVLDPASTDIMELTMRSNEAMEVDWEVSSSMLILVMISIYILGGLAIRRKG